MIYLSYYPPKPPILIANQLQSQFRTINNPIILSSSIIKKTMLTCADRVLTCAGGKLTCANSATPFPRGRLTSAAFSPVMITWAGVVLTCAGGVLTCARGLSVVICVFLGLWVLLFRKWGGGIKAVLGDLPEWRAVTESAAKGRREIAIRRAREENAGGGDSVMDFLIFGTSREKDGTLFIRIWTPVSIKVRGLVVLLHGLNEHSARYSDFAKQLNVNGYKVYGMDWIGHGGSDGLHAYVHSLDYAVMDLKSFIEKVLGENPGLPCFCYGHSTGGAIILKAALDPILENKIAGIVLTSPAIGVQPSHPIFSVLAPVFSLLIPKYQFSAANKKGMRVSRDPDALLRKYSDPLVYTGSIRVRTGYEILWIASYLQQNLKQIKVPFLVLHGSADTVTDPEASQKLYKEASSIDKSIKLYPGLLHDLLFEPEREEIVKSIIEWLNNRMQGKALHEV